MLELDARLLAKKFDHEMRLCGCARRGVIELARIGLGESHELRERVGRHLWIDHKQQRILRNHSNRREVALRIVGQLRVGRRDNGETRGDHQ